MRVAERVLTSREETQSFLNVLHRLLQIADSLVVAVLVKNKVKVASNFNAAFFIVAQENVKVGRTVLVKFPGGKDVGETPQFFVC